MPTTTYNAKRRRAAAVSDAMSRAGRDIGRLPPVRDPQRKARGRESYEAFCREYFPHRFSLAWSMHHRRAIDRVEAAVRKGGLFAYGMPRGFGKTTLAEVAVMWAVLYGLRKYVMLIGSDGGAAIRLIKSIQTELTCNDRLLEDFPEVCFPIRALEGIACRANGQLFAGRRTHIGWTKTEIVMPTIRGSAASGAIIGVAGLTAAIRGRKHTRPDGSTIRPDFAVLDDPQTNRSARSPTQTSDRIDIILGAVLGLVGPDQQMAAVMPCTVIAPDDLADRMLNRADYPEWQGERTKLLLSLPKNDGLWERYRQIRDEGKRNGNGTDAANRFYEANREAMDAGAEAAWPAKHAADEVSAVQNAMNLRFSRGPAAFAAEYQNEPIDAAVEQEWATAEEIARKTNGVPRGIVPMDFDLLTAFVDVQGSILYWMVCAWKMNFTGAVVDYGTFPNQHREHFSLREIARTLKDEFKTSDEKAAWFAGLKALTEQLLGTEYRRQDGACLRISKCLIDSNYATDTVYAFCRQATHAALIVPSVGRSIKAGDTPMAEYRRRPGERYGWHWYMPAKSLARGVQHVVMDVNHYKTQNAKAIAMKPQELGELSFFGQERDRHWMLADHFTSETPRETTGSGRTLIEWKLIPGHENHYLDCAAGCRAGASMAGAKSDFADDAEKKTRTPIVLSQIQKDRKTKGK